MFDADSFRIAVQEELKKYGYWYDTMRRKQEMMREDENNSK